MNQQICCHGNQYRPYIAINNNQVSEIPEVFFGLPQLMGTVNNKFCCKKGLNPVLCKLCSHLQQDSAI